MTTEEGALRFQSHAKVPLNETAPYESCGIFLSFLAYPHASDVNHRAEFVRASVIWAIAKRAAGDLNWGEQPLCIKAYFLTGDLGEVRKIWLRGAGHLNRRIICAEKIFIPVLLNAIQKRGRPLSGFAPTLENLWLEVHPLLGLKETSKATFLSRTWKESRPVMPAAAAVWLWMRHRATTAKASYGESLLHLFFSLADLRELLNSTEEFRELADEVKRFEIRAADTMRFSER